MVKSIAKINLLLLGFHGIIITLQRLCWQLWCILYRVTLGTFLLLSLRENYKYLIGILLPCHRTFHKNAMETQFGWRIYKHYKSWLDDYMQVIKRRISCQNANLCWLIFCRDLVTFLVYFIVIQYEPYGKHMPAIFSSYMKLDKQQGCWKMGLIFKIILTSCRYSLKNGWKIKWYRKAGISGNQIQGRKVG